MKNKRRPTKGGKRPWYSPIEERRSVNMEPNREPAYSVQDATATYIVHEPTGDDLLKCTHDNTSETLLEILLRLVTVNGKPLCKTDLEKMRGDTYVALCEALNLVLQPSSNVKIAAL